MNLFAERARWLERLRRDHAFPGAREAGVVLDASDGTLVEYVVGEEFSVSFDEAKLAIYDKLIVLHTHPTDNPANEWDWQWLAEHANVREFWVVAPTVTFSLIKPDAWRPAVFWIRTPFDDWQGHAMNLVVERGFTSFSPPDDQEWASIETEANRRMARQFQMNFFEGTP
jgi:hypothetical protein